MRIRLLLLVLSAGLLWTGCATSSVPASDGVLRVGIAPDSPPLIFRQGGEWAGVEAAFARKLAPELGRELVFVEMEWSRLLDALEANRIDMVMSGMSITPARAFRVRFTQPYMTAGLTALFHRSDFAPTGLIPSVMRFQNGTIGCVKDTTGSIYVKNAYGYARVVEYPTFDAAVKALKEKRVGMVIHDAPMVWWTVSRNEDSLAAFAELLNREELAWAIAKANPQLLKQVNEILEQWRADGSGVELLRNWLPGM